MKTSNYILLSFLTILFSGILWLFIGAKNHEINYKKSIVTKEKSLESFSVIVAEKGAYVKIKNGKHNKLIQKYHKDFDSVLAPFVVRKDTLYIYSEKNSGFKDYRSRMLSEIFCTNLKSIIAKEKAKIHLNAFQSDSIQLIMEKARLDGMVPKIPFVRINVKGSFIRFEGGNIQSFHVILDSTELQSTLNTIQTVKGLIKNKSHISSPINKRAELNIDATSTIYTR